MIVLFHENVLLLSTYKFIVIHRNFGAFVYESVEKQMLTAIALVIKQQNLLLCLARVISLSGHLPGSIFSREGDIASTQNLLISFKPII